MVLEFDMSVLDVLEDDIIRVGNDSLRQMRDLAIDFAPERTGELRGGIHVLKYFEKGSLYGEVGVIGVRHAPFQHFGTKFNEARPFLVQAYDRIAPAFVASLSQAGGLSVGLQRGVLQYAFAPGTRQYTYLQPGQTPPDSAYAYRFVQGGDQTLPRGTDSF